MNSDEESCFRNLMERAEGALRAFDCYCERGDTGEDICHHCHLRASLVTCTQATARAAEHDKAMEQVDVNAMELMGRRREAPTPEERLSKLSTRITTLDDDVVQRLERLERHVGFVPPGTP